jgi:hypothetical protein
MNEVEHKSLYEVAVIQTLANNEKVILIAPFPVMCVSKKAADMEGVKAALQLKSDVDVNTLGIIVRPFTSG